MKILTHVPESSQGESDRYASIPQELRDRRIWMVWRSERGSKIPYRTSGGRGSSTDPNAWTTFEDAVATEQRGGFAGIALAITDPYCGIDLDGCLDESGNVAEWAQPIISSFAGVAYGEISPSRTGVKLITRARKPPRARCVKKMGEGKQQIEIYDHGRFWCMTGLVIVVSLDGKGDR